MERHRLNGSRDVARTAPERPSNIRKRYMPSVDGRTHAAKRWAEVCSNLISDQGGLDNVSEARLHLVRRLAAVTSIIEDMEAAHVRGESIDMDAYLALVNASVRLSNTIGLSRKSKQVPDLDSYLRNRQPRLIEHSEDDDD